MKWEILNKIKETEKKSRTEQLIEILLSNRNLKTKRQIEEFLEPCLRVDGLEIDRKSLKKAAGRIKKAVENKEEIVVYGDYDADGICATAILWETLHSLSAHVMPYIPHRIDEGYGLSKKGIDNLAKPSLIITVDQGITKKEEVEYAKKLGIEVIITDHHVLPKKLPEAFAVVHTTALSGSGVAFVLAREIRKAFSQTLSKQDIDLAAIGTIADMMPLVGLNRTLVKFGLEELNKTEREGLIELIKEAGLTLGKIGTWEVSFIIVPRINAMGRMVHALDSLRLLCTRNHRRAEDLAQKLGLMNRERQSLTRDTFLHARGLWLKTSDGSSKKLIFVEHESYNQGIIGLVAGKLVEEFYRPAVVVFKDEVYSKASARSVNGFNIIEAIRSLNHLLLDCGGHPMAAGFTVETKNLVSVCQELSKIAEENLNEEKLTKVLKIDCEINLNDLRWELYEKIQKFAPFGLGNPEPVFVSRNVRITNARLVGKNSQHLKLVLEKFEAIGFGMAKFYSQLSPDKPVDLAYTVCSDSWNGEEKLQLKVKDIKTGD